MITLPLTAGLDARALLGQVQASYDQTARAGGHRRPTQLPAGAPPVPAGLAVRIEQARFLACELRPLLEQVCATYAEAVTVTGASFGDSVEEDQPSDAFFRAIGADDLGDVLCAIFDRLGECGLNGGWPVR